LRTSLSANERRIGYPYNYEGLRIYNLTLSEHGDAFARMQKETSI